MDFFSEKSDSLEAKDMKSGTTGEFKKRLSLKDLDPFKHPVFSSADMSIADDEETGLRANTK